MRVIAGEHRGRRLKAPAGRSTRPTGDRVREAVFAMLGGLERARVLDLFAGSGALGIESLSRGAARAVFVERDAHAIRALRENLQALAIDPRRADVRRGHAAGVLRAAAAAGESYDLLFVDPPYAQAGRWGAELSVLLPAVLAPRARVVVESDRRSPLSLALPIATERRYGDTSITIHTSACPDPPTQ
jgi:16S rRNA (guanine966-N2)-methyltransferase